jgi:malate permease and related proteins
MYMSEPIIKIIPILLLIVFGSLMQYKKWFDDHFINNLKKMVISIVLPCVLFVTFKNMALEVEYLLLSVISFVMLFVYYFMGVLIKRIFHLKSIIIPFFTTSTAFGLLGLQLFEGVYGIEKLGDLILLGIGNEFFVWFVYLTLIKQKLGNTKFSIKTLVDFITSPLILAIFAGLLVNLLGLVPYFEQYILLSGLSLTFESIASLSTPLILIIIGFGIRINAHYLKGALQLLVIRLFITLTIGFLFKQFIINPVFDPSFNFNLAYFTFLILPPPFSLSIFVGQYCSEEDTIITNNAVVLSTITCVMLFIGMVLLNS